MPTSPLGGVDPDTPTAARTDAAASRRRLVLSILWVGLAALAFVVLLLVLQARTNESTATAAEQARAFTPPPAPTPTTGQSAGDLIAVVGDEWAAPRNTVANRPWTSLLQNDLGVRVRTFASDGGAYVARAVATGGATFDSTVASIPSDATMVVFFGGARDADDDSSELAAAATKAITDAANRAPMARLVLIGPVPLEPGEGSDLQTTRRVLRIVAGTTRADWVDPVQEKWLGSPRYWADSDGGPSAAGNRRLAQRMEATLEPLLHAKSSASAS